MSAQENSVALPLRSHTILGVCEAIGEDFHFNPVFLRVILAAGVLYSPLLAIGAYFGLGAVVLVSRLLFPNEQQPASASEEAPSNDQQELRKAA
jgi:phage shock protein C